MITLGGSIAESIRTFQAIQRESAQNQQRITTGSNASGAKYDGASYMMAQMMFAEMESSIVIRDSINRSKSIIDVAMTVGNTLTDTIQDLRLDALALTDSNLSDSDRAAYVSSYNTLRAEIGRQINSAEFNGVNLLDGSKTELRTLVSNDGSEVIKTKTYDLREGQGTVFVPSTVTTVVDAENAVATLDQTLVDLSQALGSLATGSNIMDIQLELNSKLSDAIEAAHGNLVDANLSKEAAKLAALRVKEQLAIQTMAMANKQPQILLALFS